MILVIDTSSAIATIALIDEENGRDRWVSLPARDPDFRETVRRIAQSIEVAKVAVATGPGSFTGLRAGVAFGLGFAIGRDIPIVPLPSLDLQRARSTVPATAVLEAGRGRVYYQLPGSTPALGEPVGIPIGHPLVGNVTQKTQEALLAARHHFVAAEDQRDFAQAARKLLEVAREVPYRNLEIEYMQSFSAKR